MNQGCYCVLALALFIQVAGALQAMSWVFSACDLSQEETWRKSHDGYAIQSWTQSLTPRDDSRKKKTKAYFESEKRYIIAYDVEASSDIAWRAFGYKRLDGWLYGKTDSKGDFLPGETLFLYPDFKTALLGTFTDDALIEGVETRITHYRCKDGVMELKHSSPKRDSILYKPHQPTMTYVCPTPLSRDPYDRRSVYVAPSKEFPEMGQEDSLYAKRIIPKHTLITYYNGFLLNVGEVPRNVSDMYLFEMNNAEFNETTSINLPESYSDLKKYIATLGHKANHHFTKYNAKLARVKHPVYGEILCLKAMQYIRKDQEIFIHYGYNISDPKVPMWYRNLQTKIK